MLVGRQIGPGKTRGEALVGGQIVPNRAAKKKEGQCASEQIDGAGRGRTGGLTGG